MSYKEDDGWDAVDDVLEHCFNHISDEPKEAELLIIDTFMLADLIRKMAIQCKDGEPLIKLGSGFVPIACSNCSTFHWVKIPSRYTPERAHQYLEDNISLLYDMVLRNCVKSMENNNGC